MPTQENPAVAPVEAAAAEGSASAAMKEPAAEPATAPGTHASAPRDAHVESVLEKKGIINWWSGGSMEPLQESKVMDDGGCLHHSASRGLTGCDDDDQTLSLALRMALHREMTGPRGGNYEQRTRREMARRDRGAGFQLDDRQWKAEWGALVAAVATAHTSLSEVHVLILAHVLRRPIIVFSSKVCPCV